MSIFIELCPFDQLKANIYRNEIDFLASPLACIPVTCGCLLYLITLAVTSKADKSCNRTGIIAPSLTRACRAIACDWCNQPSVQQPCVDSTLTLIRAPLSVYMCSRAGVSSSSSSNWSLDIPLRLPSKSENCINLVPKTTLRYVGITDSCCPHPRDAGCSRLQFDSSEYSGTVAIN